MITTLALAGFLLAPPATHPGSLSPRPPATAGGPPWPFALERSWALGGLGVDGDVARMIGFALVAATLAGFALAAIVALGVLPAAAWPAAVALGAFSSMALLVLFFHPWLVLGLAIDLALLWAALVVGWDPASAGA